MADAPITVPAAAAASVATRPAPGRGAGPRAGKVGLVLTGGGARAAYQVGVLVGIRRVLLEAGWPAARNPFDVLTGTSAGAINAAALAAGADDFLGAVARLSIVWGGFEPGQVYRVDSRGALGNAARWIGSAGLGWLIARQPRSLFDTAPLRDLLLRMIDFERLARNLAEGRLDSLAIATSSYTSGHHVTFYQSHEPREPWVRSQRLASRAGITVDHLMASAAIPFLFPSIALDLEGRLEYFGDGSMRQTAPISPAVHLGAERILVIGAGAPTAPPGVEPRYRADYPSLAQVGAHALSSIFLDALASDLERLGRINRTLGSMPPELRAASSLRLLDTLVIAPSRALDRLAAPHIRELPRTVRAMLRVVGANQGRGSGIASYLLFHRSYTRHLIAMGRRDALDQRGAIVRFFFDGSAG